MKGDFSRFNFDPRKHYAGVLHQQGRVWLDSDWNEDVLERLNLLRQQLNDIIGRSGVPEPGTAFQISPSQTANVDDFQIAAGRCYINGVSCQLEADASYLSQPDLPQPSRLSLPTDGSTLFALVFLEVWDRLVTYLEDDTLREIALQGPDTATRLKTVAQVKIIKLPSSLTDFSCKNTVQFLPTPGNGTLTTLQPAPTIVPDPCQLPDQGNFTGRENHLYRVQVHDGGDVLGASTGFAASVRLGADAAAGAITLSLATPLNANQIDAAQRAGNVTVTDNGGAFERASLAGISVDGKTLVLAQSLHKSYAFAANAAVTVGVAGFKWSRDNASFAVGATVQNDGVTLTLSSLGRDTATALRIGDLVEISNDPSELGPARGFLTYLKTVPDPDGMTVVLQDPLPLGFASGLFGSITSPPASPPSSPPGSSISQPDLNLVLRRWDGRGDANATYNDTSTPAMNLGDGVHIQFGGSDLRPGDYWQFATRSANGSVEALINAPPAGIVRHWCALAVVSFGPPPLTSPPILVPPRTTPLLPIRLEPGISTQITPTPQPILPSPVGLSIFPQPIRPILLSPPSSPPSGLVMTVVQDCRNLFPELIHFPAVEDGIHVTGLFIVAPGSLTQDKVLDTSSPLINDTNVPVSSLGGIAVHCDAGVDQNGISRATCYVTIELPIQPGGLATAPAAYSLATLAGNASANNNIITWIPTADAINLLIQVTEQMTSLPPGSDPRIQARLTLKGNFIRDQQAHSLYLDGETFGSHATGAPNVSLSLPSGDKRRGGDFEMWFWLVVAPVALKDITPDNDLIYAGNVTSITIDLTDSAPRGGLSIAIESFPSQVVQVPLSVLAQPGSRVATFQAQANIVGQAIIKASIPGSPPDVVSTTLTVVRPAPFALIFSPTVIFPGGTATGTITLNAPAPVGMPPIALSTNLPGIAILPTPATLPVLENATSAKFTIVGGQVRLETTATITAALPGGSVSTPLIVRLPPEPPIPPTGLRFVNLT